MKFIFTLLLFFMIHISFSQSILKEYEYILQDNVLKITGIYCDSIFDLETLFWDFDDGTIANDSLPEHKFIHNGNYSVCVSVKFTNGIIDTYCKPIVINTAISKNSIYVHPNPTSNGKFKIVIKDTTTTYNVYIYDVIGNLIKSFKTQSDNTDYNCDISGYSDGKFFIVICSDNYYQTVPITKQ